MTFLTILLLAVGLGLVLAGSDVLVDGSSAIARRSGMSEFVIGLTIVGIGTSMPELVVSWFSAFKGNTDMSIGNIVGSNIFNTCLILGCTALILPITITKDNLKRDMPLNILATALLLIFGMCKGSSGVSMLSRLDGAIMLICFALYICFSLVAERKSTTLPDESNEDAAAMPLWKAVLFVIGGLAALIIGGRLFVNNAVTIAHSLGWSDKFIGVTLLAGGTSLPELATCVIAAIKKKGQLALGNILGSNVSNILLILGGASLIRPIPFNNITFTDSAFLLISAVILPCFYLSFNKGKIGRIDGAVLLTIEIVYMYLLIRAL